MSPLSHALWPLIIGRRWAPLKEVPLSHLGLIALAGVAPDVINPHIYLVDRFTSWSHTILATIAVQGIFTLLAIRRKLPWTIAWLCGGAYLLHLMGDAITGGIAPLFPFSQIRVLQTTLLPFWVWPLLDGLAIYLINRQGLIDRALESVRKKLRPLGRRLQNKATADSNP